MHKFIGLIGMSAILGTAWLMSNNRRRISLRVVIWGTALQVFFAFIVIPNSPLNAFAKQVFNLNVAPGEAFFNLMNDAIVKLLGFTADGARFIFGNLVDNNVPIGIGTPGSNMPVKPIGGYVAVTGAYFAFTVLPTIIFFSSLMAVLYHVGLMQKVVVFFSWIMEKCLRTSGAETLSTSANIFMGQTEAPLCIRPFIEGMTNSELMCIMVGGFANTAGGVMAAYVGMLKDYYPDIAGHLLTMSIMSAPASLVIAKIVFPETQVPKTRGGVTVNLPKVDANLIDSAASGAASGLSLALNVAAMLIAFIALVSAVNYGIHGIGSLLNWTFGTSLDLSLQYLLGLIFAPFTWLMGVPWKDCFIAGRLMGEKIAINEFVAFLDLANLTAQGLKLDYRSFVILSYALCGFANFSSIAIQIGGISGMAPSRRHDLARLGLRAMFGGVLASCMTGTIAGLFV